MLDLVTSLSFCELKLVVPFQRAMDEEKEWNGSPGRVGEYALEGQEVGVVQSQRGFPMSKALRLAIYSILLTCSLLASALQAREATAWRGERFDVNLAGVIGRSDIVLGRANTDAMEAMPLGNGRLGVAVWSADGFTAQLNRADTLPYRYSTGQVTIPGLKVLTSAKDFTGRLDLYNGAFVERGGGMTVTAYVQTDSDTLIVDVTGADPDKPQTALLKLWEPRQTEAVAHGDTGLLAHSWVDNQNPGASGRRFGSLAAITAEGRNVSASLRDERTVSITFTPKRDGSFRIVVASPHYAGDEAHATAQSIAARALASRDAHKFGAWWHDFWLHADLIKISSADGAGEYMENLRVLYLFSAAAESKGDYPGSQAGVGDLFSAVRDHHQWDPAAFWHWNLRMQVAANLGAGLPQLNEPYFRLYRENLVNMEKWTREHMGGAPGICVPETMRFNGEGIEFETWGGNTKQVSGWNCDAASGPYFNARTISTGAEVSLWIWQQYLATGDKAFLVANFPVMANSARFLLAYEKPGADGLLHTAPSNAHETQWDVIDPTTDLSARQTLYPATIEAATLLHKEPALVRQLRAAIVRIPPLPRTEDGIPASLLSPAADAEGKDVIGVSYQPAARVNNVENIGLEPVWPYGLIGDTSPLFPLARRTYLSRPNRAGIDWSYDPVQAARLGLGSEVRETLIRITEANQRYVNGFAKWGGDGGEFYVEQAAIVALALQEALVQDYDGVIRIAPALPPGWDFDGAVSVRGNTKVWVQVRKGTPTAVGLEVKTAQPIKIRNPWPGNAVKVTAARTGEPIVNDSKAPVLMFTAKAGAMYRIQRSAGDADSRFAPIDGKPAASFKKLGPVQIGISPSL